MYNKKHLTYPYDFNSILRSKKLIKEDLLKNKNLIEKKIAILGGSTIGEIKFFLELFLLKVGIKPIIYESNYNQYFEESVFENKNLANFKPDAIYIHTTIENINKFPEVQFTKEMSDNLLNSELSKYKNIWAKLYESYNCIIIQNNFEFPQFRPLGNLDSSHSSGKTLFINRINHCFSEASTKYDYLYVNDINYLSSLVGVENWKDNSKYFLYKYAISFQFIPLLCDNISSILGSIFGLTKKNIVLDLDNTLWGGIIGDEGVDNINLGKDDALGESFALFQSYINELNQRGVLISIASKNEKNIAKKGLDKKESILKYSSFISSYINWERKDLNIIKMAKKLNLSLDSFVFIDDNPVERNLVEVNLPEINVLEANNPEEFLVSLDRSGYFEPTEISDEDFNRSISYRSNIKIEDNKKLKIDYNDFLLSLKMKSKIKVIEKSDIKRITQLINKTNQFNLTTQRVIQSDIEKICNSAQYISISGQLIDKYNDHGLVSVIISNLVNSILDIKIWVMSCRVFNRQLEFAMFENLLNQCKIRNIKKINSTYKKTEKNSIVENFYETLGFEKINGDKNTSRWSFSINKDIPVLKHNIKVE